jgi:hypothetical protein
MHVAFYITRRICRWGVTTVLMVFVRVGLRRSGGRLLAIHGYKHEERR